MKTLLRNQQEALAANKLARSRTADWRRSTFTPFKKGDQVWLDSRNLKTIYHKKTKPKWEEPFVITKVLGPVTYRLKLLTSWQIHNVFHAMLLKPYRENEIYRENFTEPPPEPPPELVEGEKRSMKSRLSMVTGNRDNFQWWQNTGWLQKMPPPLTFLLSPSRHMFPFQQYDMDKDHLQSHWLLGRYKTCAGNRKRPDSHYPLTFRPLQNHWKVLNCWHVFIPLWWLYYTVSAFLSTLSLKNALIWLQTWEWLPFITLFL